MTGPSPHLTWDELGCEDGTPYPRDWRTTRAVDLAAAFEALRAACGNRPIAIVSAYRTPTHNAQAGGATLSQHMAGRALDLQCPAHLTLDEFEGLARSVVSITKLRGIGRYEGKRSIHIDVRPSARVIRWHDKRAWSEPV